MITKTLACAVLIMCAVSAQMAYGGPQGGGGGAGRAGGGIQQGRPAAAQRTAPAPIRRGPAYTPNRTPSMSDVRRRPVGREVPIGPTTPAGPGRPVQTPMVHSTSRPQFDQIKQQLKQGRAQLNAQPSATELKRGKNRIQDNLRSANAEAKHARQKVHDQHPHSAQWFNNNFFETRNYHPHYEHRWDNGWHPVNWASINSWLGWNWAAPIYYDEQSYPAYYPLEETVVQSVPAADQEGWQLIGQFATGTSVQEAPYSNMFVELAVNRQGDLAGTYYNATRDQLYPIEGVIDQETQQAIWRLSDRADSPMMTTGIYNLTQDAAPVTVHFSNGQEQPWVLVRMD